MTKKYASSRLRTYLLASIGSMLPFVARAQVFGGPGLQKGLDDFRNQTGSTTATDVVGLTLKAINFLLNITLILAVLAIIVAGIYLIVSNGDDSAKDKAKNIIFYAIAGILLILLSRVIVMAANNIFE